MAQYRNIKIYTKLFFFTSLFFITILLHQAKTNYASQACLSGFYILSDRCTVCPSGKACDGATITATCTSSQYSPQGSSSCSQCPVGYYCPNSSTITKCPDNSYCTIGSTSPTACQDHHKCTRSTEIPCPSGTYRPNSHSTHSCIPCPAGSKCPNQGGSGFVSCQNGEWSPPGSTACTPCVEGQSCGDKTKPPVKCAQGQKSNPNKTSCIDCQTVGQICPDPSDTSTHQACSAGQYIDALGVVCIPCPPGFECSDGVNKVACSTGKYSHPGQSSCTNCSPGYNCQADNYYACPIGTYKDTTATGPCISIPSGQYSADSTQAPQACAAGTYLNADQNGCLTCPQQHTCSGGSNSPVQCAQGNYVLANVCTPCPADKSCENVNIAPMNCANGQYVDSVGRICRTCPRGHYCSAGVKAACPVDTYSFEGADSCYPKLTIGFAGIYFPIPVYRGFYLKASDGTIAQCAQNKYCPSPMHGQQQCPNGWWSSLGAWTCSPNFVYSVSNQLIFGTGAQTLGNNQYKGKDFLHHCPTGTYTNGGTTCIKIPRNMGYNLSNYSIQSCGSNEYSNEGEASCRATPAGFKLQSGLLVKCAAGKYCEPGTNEQNCPNGTYSPEGSANCYSCPAGYQCSGGTLTLCERGKYSRDNKTICSDCDPGFICYPGSTSPRPVLSSCPKGYYCTNGGSFTIIPCPIGKYGIMQRATTENQGCYTCPAGYFCPLGAQDYKFYPCSSNHYCIAGTTAQASCPSGTYFSGMGARAQSQCQYIPEGYALEGTELILCPLGSYCSLGISKQFCPNGYYTSSEGARSIQECLKCPPGFYCKDGAVQPADIAHYIPFSGAPDKHQYASPPGSGYAATGNALYYTIDEQLNKVAQMGKVMSLCKNGLYAGRSGMSMDQCIRCQLGKDCSDGLSPKNCPAGKYCPHNYQSYAIDCPRGTYSSTPGLKQVDQCTQCPAGQYCIGGQSSTADCPKTFYCPAQTPYPIRCPDGYSGQSTNLKTAADCTICPQNNFCRDGVKVQCPTGTYQKKPGSAECLLCPGGYACTAGAVTACDQGKFSIPGDPSGCQNCPIGYACKRKAISFVDLPKFRCQNGYNCNAAGTTHAALLTTYAQYSIAGIVFNCPQGFYHLKAGATSLADCKRIPAGFYQTIAQFSSSGQLLQCTAGHYCPEGTSVPIKCPQRTFNPFKLAKSVEDCFQCLAGFYCPSQGLSAYTDCPVGHYCPDGTDIPQPCPQGTYSNNTKLKSSSECTLCDAGKYCHQRGMTAVGGDCYEGFYCKSGSPRPDPIGKIYGDICPAGGFCLLGSQSPSACPDGKYNPFQGAKSSSDCAPCTPGSYCLGANTPNPTGLCKGGYYCPLGSSSETQSQAQQGYYAPAGSPIQIPCEPGTYATNVAQAECTKCEKGKYCPNSQMTAALQCPVGFYCPSKQQQDTDGKIYNKIPCPPGTYRDTVGAQSLGQCLDCPPGKACPFYGMISGTTYTCNAGFFCKKKATSVNPTVPDPSGNFGPCIKGSYCAQGTSTPAPCDSGTYLPYQGARAKAECIKCHPGLYCSGAGLSVPTQACQQGYYCPEASTSATQVECGTGHFCPPGAGGQIECPSGFYQDSAGQYSCKVCTAGNYCKGGVQTSCPQGTYCPI